MKTPEELQAEIDTALKELAEKSQYATSGSKQVAQVFAATAQLTEISTARIVRLTYWLLALTAALLFFAAAQFTFELAKDSKQPREHDQTNDHLRSQQSKPDIMPSQITNR